MQKFSNQLGQFRVKSESYIKQLLLNWSTYKGSRSLLNWSTYKGSRSLLNWSTYKGSRSLLNWSTYKGSCHLVSSDRSNYQEPIS